jgi:hypothetical protein
MPDPNLPPLIMLSTPLDLEDAIKRTTDIFLAFGRACSKALASISPLLLKAMQEQWEFERGPTIGRKRRARRARGRRRGRGNA